MSEPLTLEIESAQSRHVVHVPTDRQQCRLTDLLRQASLPLNTRCGQRMLCDGCRVELLEGTLVHMSSGQALRANGEPHLVRACEYRLNGSGPVKLRIPPRSLLAYHPQIVTDFRINVSHAHAPLVQGLLIEREELAAGLPLEQALCAAVALQCNNGRPVRICDLAHDQLAAISSSPQFAVTAELRQDHWLISEVFDQPGRPALGAAIDIGTTTVALLLVDLSDGKALAQSAMFNQQMHLGDDVVTRITLCLSDPPMVGRLQEALAQRTIAPLLQEALQRAGASASQVACLSIAGNTTMLHLAAGVNPAPLGVAPFTPVFLEHRVLSADDFLGERCAAACRIAAPVHLLPGPAAYVGADLSAGIVASGLLYDEGPSLLVDVGTNGEIILKHEGKLYGCATAAGPAFEGAGLSSGIRAGDGAISHIVLSADPFKVHAKWIGQHPGNWPTGMCGSAYVDLLAEARRIGLLNPMGRFEPDAVPGSAQRLIPWGRNDLALRIAHGQAHQDIVVSQLDVARLLQAKAAIAAGILTLLERIGLKPEQIKRLYLAGGFGTHMDRRHAIACGLLPGFAMEQVQTVGNTSLAGAYLALLDSSILEEMARIRRQIEIVELNLDPRFEERYIDQLMLPEPPPSLQEA